MLEAGNSKRLLLLGFGTLIGILLLIAVFGLTQMQHIIDKADDITNDRTRKVELALAMNDVAIERLAILRAVVITEDYFERDELLLRFRYLPLEFIKSRDALLVLLDTDEEKQLMEKVIKGATDNYWTEDGIVNLIENDELDEAQRLMGRELSGTINNLLVAVRNMINYQQEGFKDDIAKNNLYHKQSNQWMATLFTIGLLLSLAIATGVLSRFKSLDNRQRKTMHELIEARDDALSAKQSAEQANQSKTEFLSSMSHELRTPLNAVIGFSQLLKDEDLTEDQRDNVEMISNSGEHLLTLINEVLELSRIETGKSKLNFEYTNLIDMFGTCKKMVDSQLEKYDVELYLPDETEDLKAMALYTDVTRFKQILLNIITNAIKYNEPGGRVDVMVSRIENRKIKVCVKDTGTGIPYDKQERVFNSFDRLGREAGLIEGSGVGLAISKRLVEEMGGTIGFESIPNNGSTFWVEIQEADINENQ